MADFDSFDYDIAKKLPEWWKGFGALEPVNQYTQEKIAEILEGLLTSTGVVQPLNCWITLPEEYTWYHHYQLFDEYLTDEVGDKIANYTVNTLFSGNKIHARVPNTKRNCHARIKLKLLGTDTDYTRDENRNLNELKKNENIEKLTIQNANQEIILKNIPTTSTIEILTETKEILIDGVQDDNLIEGYFEKIKPTIKYANYKEPYIDKDGKTLYKNISIEDENKKTEIIFSSTKTVNYDLQIYLYKPVYTTEQNIRINSVSAFPIESVELCGYFCHPFNNQSGYKTLWKKTYKKESRTVYDRITKQFDCERFFIRVKFYGIGTPLEKGFPQEINASKKAYQPNPILDRWGKIYNLPRREYRTDITEDEEPYTFPKYYTYPIEQDYWYEERLINEYCYDKNAINALFIKDNDLNNIGMLECIYPFMDDIWVYTETIDPEVDIVHELKNISICSIQEDEETLGVGWGDIQLIKGNPLVVSLDPKIGQDDFSYQTKKLKCSFNLKPYDDTVPKDITIKGIELSFKTDKTIQSNTIKLSDKSNIIIPYFSPNFDEPVLEKINIIPEEEVWISKKGYYTIGGENNLFQEKEISREQLFKGNDGKVDFELIFTNENNFLESTLYLTEISLNIYYEVIQNNYKIDVEFDKKEIDLRKNEPHKINMKINLANEGKIEIHDKNVFIIIPPELKLTNECNGYNFSLEINEAFSIDDIIIEPTIFPEDGIRTGKYDVLVFCEDKVISNEILIRGKIE